MVEQPKTVYLLSRERKRPLRWPGVAIETPFLCVISILQSNIKHHFLSLCLIHFCHFAITFVTLLAKWWQSDKSEQGKAIKSDDLTTLMMRLLGITSCPSGVNLKPRPFPLLNPSCLHKWRLVVIQLCYTLTSHAGFLCYTTYYPVIWLTSRCSVDHLVTRRAIIP